MKKRSILLLLPFFMWMSAVDALALSITKSGGWLETAYVQWTPVANATSYTVTYTGNGKTDEPIDSELIREYPVAQYLRADILGLKAGTYSITVSGGGESATVNNIQVKANDRSGFAHAAESPWKSASGAYNEDGTLKSNARVIYITASNNVATTEFTMTKPDGSTQSYTGIADALLNTFQKEGTQATPLAIRVIGKVTNEQVGVGTGTAALLQVKGKDPATSLCQVTIEGVGNDATAYGWGVKVMKCGNVEVRNLAFLNFGDDGTQVQDGNYNIWVHNCDYFYGAVGSAADQAKGDGSLDSKESSYCTYSLNHFWDAGKCNLLGMHDSIRGYLTYHHNWYDHSDSRHPRARWHWAHVYNNYYDGVAEYGAGASEYSNLFCEGNYFKNTNRPMVISMQGNGGTTFSDEDGGLVKSWNNTFDNCTNMIPYSTNSTNFDFYDAQSRTEAVPSSVKAKQGTCTFENLDFNLLNAATVEAPADARATVMAWSGRCQGGDLKFQFTDADNDLSHDRITGLSNVLELYEPSGEITVYNPNTGEAVSVQTIPTLTNTEGKPDADLNLNTIINPIVFKAGGTATGITVTALPAGLSSNITGNTLTISGTPSVTGTFAYTVSTTGTTIAATKTYTLTISGESSGEGGGVCDLVASSNLFTFIGSTSTSKGTVTYEGVDYSCALKMEGSTLISFSTSGSYKLIMVFDSIGTVKVDGVSKSAPANAAGNMVVELTIASGAHTIEKGNSINLFYLEASKLPTTDYSNSKLHNDYRIAQQNENLVVTNGDITSLEVYTITGAPVAKNSNSNTLPLSGINKGVYIVRINNETVAKFIWQ